MRALLYCICMYMYFVFTYISTFCGLCGVGIDCTVHTVRFNDTQIRTYIHTYVRMYHVYVVTLVNTYFNMYAMYCVCMNIFSLDISFDPSFFLYTTHETSYVISISIFHNICACVDHCIIYVCMYVRTYTGDRVFH